MTKVPRFAFEKFPEANTTLTTQMKSVGETMAIGRTFKESLQKALRGLEVGRFGIGCDRRDRWGTRQPADARRNHAHARHGPTPNASGTSATGFSPGMSVEEVHRLTHIDPWFLRAIQDLIGGGKRTPRRWIARQRSTPELMLKAKQHGFVDRQLGDLWNVEMEEVRRAAERASASTAVFKSVDTCAAEFEAYTPYYYTHVRSTASPVWGQVDSPTVHPG